jgi:hypothetical protein
MPCKLTEHLLRKTLQQPLSLQLQTEPTGHRVFRFLVDL